MDYFSDILILCPLTVEWEAMATYLNADPDPPRWIVPTATGYIGPYRIVLCKHPGPTNVVASGFAANAVAKWRPRWVLLLGIGGFVSNGELSRGDVAIASKVYGYEYGKIDRGVFSPRDDLDAEVDFSWLAHATQLSESGSPTADWYSTIECDRPDGTTSRPSARVVPLATGEKVVDDPSFPFFVQASARLPSSFVVEMEASGVATGIKFESVDALVGLIVVRGISDLPRAQDAVPESRGTVERDNWKPYAAQSAAAFANALFNAPGTPEPKVGRAFAPPEISRRITKPTSVTPPETFVGRETELGQLDDWYFNSTAPTCLVFGTPGVGKTHLVRQWLGSLHTPLLYFDASFVYGDSPGEAAEALFEFVARDGFAVDAGTEAIDAVDLAGWMRASNALFVFDSGELLVEPSKSMTPMFAHLLSTFTSIPLGSGRLLFTSSIRPTRLGESKDLAAGRSRVISSGRGDDLQLSGLDDRDAFKYLDDLAEERHTSLSREEKVGIVRRFEGHPLAMDWYLQLPNEERVGYLKSVNRATSMFTQLNRLLRRVTLALDDAERRVLDLLGVLRKPTNELNLCAILGYLTRASEVADAADRLRARSLIEWSSDTQGGFLAHGVVREWLHEDLGPERLARLHLVAADHFALQNDAYRSAYHYARAGRSEEARHWRNIYTSDQFEAGRQAYWGGDFEASLSAASDFIDQYVELERSPLTSLYLSRAHTNRAVSRHRASFDWIAEIADLRDAVMLWPGNAYAITFLRTVFDAAYGKGIRWDAIADEAWFVLDAYNRAGAPRDRMDELFTKSAYLDLFVWCSDHDALTAVQWRTVIDALVYELDDDELLLGDGRVAASRVRALLCLAQTMTDVQGRALLLLQADHATELAYTAMPSSAQLVFLRARVHKELAYHADRWAVRLGRLVQCHIEMSALELSVPRPSGFLRLLSLIAIELADAAESTDGLEWLRQTVEAIENIGPIVDAPVQRTEFDAARIRLALKAFELSGSSEWLAMATSIVSGYLIRDRTSGILTPEIADCAIQTLELSIRRRDSGDADAGDEHELVLTKDLLADIDFAIERAAAARPSPSLEILRLQLRVRYLSKAWTADQATEPTVVADASRMARALMETDPNERTAILAVQFWRIVATRTFKREAYESAISTANAVFGNKQVWADGSYRCDVERALFYRQTFDYKLARAILRPHAESAKGTRRELYLIGLFLDAVCHSLRWDARGEAELVHDAELGISRYRLYLAYMGIVTEAPDERGAPRRTLSELRCNYFLDRLDLDLSWIDELSQELEFRGTLVQSADLLGPLHRHEDPLAKILGANVLDGVIWREIGTFLVTSAGPNEQLRQYAYRFWDIAEAWLERSLWSGKHYGKRPRKIALLNKARLLSALETNTPEWRLGLEMLESLCVPQSSSWNDHRLITELHDEVVARASQVPEL